MAADLTRGQRNNNPGNLEFNPKWQGLRTTRTDDRFAEFQSMAWGFRAMAVTLCTYQDKYAITTIGAAIARWAPASENDTGAYIKDVCQKTKLAPDETVNFHDFNEAAPIINAIAEHENGVKFNRQDLVQGCIKAGLENCPTGAVGSVVKVGAAVTGAAGTYAASDPGALISVYNSIKPIVDVAPHILQKGFWVVVVCAIAALAYGEFKKVKGAK